MNIKISTDDTDRDSLDAFCTATGKTDDSITPADWLTQQVTDWVTQHIKTGMVVLGTESDRQTYNAAVTQSIKAVEEAMKGFIIGTSVNEEPIKAG